MKLDTEKKLIVKIKYGLAWHDQLIKNGEKSGIIVSVLAETVKNPDRAIMKNREYYAFISSEKKLKEVYGL